MIKRFVNWFTIWFLRRWTGPCGCYIVVPLGLRATIVPMADLPRRIQCQLYDGHEYNGYMHSFVSSEIMVDWVGYGHDVSGTVVIRNGDYHLPFDERVIGPIVRHRKIRHNWAVEGF